MLPQENYKYQWYVCRECNHRWYGSILDVSLKCPLDGADLEVCPTLDAKEAIDSALRSVFLSCLIAQTVLVLLDFQTPQESLLVLFWQGTALFGVWLIQWLRG